MTLQAPLRQIAENSATDGSIVVGKLSESKTTTYGYDGQKGEFTDMIKAGIIDIAHVKRWIEEGCPGELIAALDAGAGPAQPLGPITVTSISMPGPVYAVLTDSNAYA